TKILAVILALRYGLAVIAAGIAFASLVRFGVTYVFLYSLLDGVRGRVVSVLVKNAAIVSFSLAVPFVIIDLPAFEFFELRYLNVIAFLAVISLTSSILFILIAYLSRHALYEEISKLVAKIRPT
ncbi:MAG: hypothetical protein AAF387_22510, partial [Pseudomonadota bacterium]